MKKYIVLFFVLIALLMVSCDGSPAPKEKDGFGLLGSTNCTLTVTDGELQNDQKKNVSYSLASGSLKYNKKLLLEGDNKKYYKSLANYLAILAADIYDTVVVDVDDNVTVAPTDNKTIYKNLGFSNIEEATIPNVTHYLFASQTHEEESGTYHVVFVTIQGTDGSTEQWLSNFNVGLNDDSYFDKVSDDFYWQNKNNHCGFDVAANMVQERLETFLSANGIVKSDKTILVFTGHSRGAAIANILGAEYELDTECKTFTYTFATPATTTDDATADTVKTVFNIINNDDVVTVMPLPSWGFVRYGINKSGSMKTYATDWQTKFGIKNYVSAGADEAIAAGGYLDNFCKSGRNVLYTIDGAVEDNHYRIYLDRAANEEEKNTVANAFQNELKTYGMEPFTNFTYTLDGGRVVAEGNICPAFVLQTLANLIGINNQGNMMATFGFLSKYTSGFGAESAYGDVISGFVAAAMNGGMRDSHAPSTYILLTQKIN